MRCVECNKVAVWARHTQFAGTHPYCDEHAKAQTDFLKEDSYTFWENIEETAFFDWFHEIENYSTRSDRFYEEFNGMTMERATEWLKSAFEMGRKSVQSSEDSSEN